MKVLVSVKRVVDPNVKIRVKSDGSGIDMDNAKMSMNPFDEIAVEEAVRLKELGKVSEIVVLSCGVEKVQDTLRVALAMGATKAILIKTEEVVSPLGIAKLIKAVVEKENPSLVLMGKQSTDDDAAQTGQMVAALLNWPQGIFASKVELENQTVKVTREIDRGTETLELTLPAVISTDLRLNAPRYVTLPKLAKARKETIEILTPDELGVNLSSNYQVLEVKESPKREGVTFVSSVDELIEKLKNEAKVL